MKDRLIKLPAIGHYERKTHEYYSDHLARERFSGILYQSVPKTKEELDRKYCRDEAILIHELVEHPIDPRTLYYLADCKEYFDNKDDAIKYFQRCAQYSSWDEEKAWAHYRAAKLQFSLSKYSECIEECAQGISARSKTIELYVVQARAFEALGQRPKACTVLEAAIAQGTDERVGFSKPSERYEGPAVLLSAMRRALGQFEESLVMDRLASDRRAVREKTLIG